MTTKGGKPHQDFILYDLFLNAQPWALTGGSHIYTHRNPRRPGEVIGRTDQAAAAIRDTLREPVRGLLDHIG